MILGAVSYVCDAIGRGAVVCFLVLTDTLCFYVLAVIMVTVCCVLAATLWVAFNIID